MVNSFKDPDALFIFGILNSDSLQSGDVDDFDATTTLKVLEPYAGSVGTPIVKVAFKLAEDKFSTLNK